jgi:hypothetical protein
MVQVVPANKVSVTLSTAAQASSVFRVREGRILTFAVRNVAAAATSFTVECQAYLCGGWLTLTKVTTPGMYLIQFGSQTEVRAVAGASVTATTIAHLSSGRA